MGHVLRINHSLLAAPRVLLGFISQQKMNEIGGQTAQIE